MSNRAFALLCGRDGMVTEVIEECPFCPEVGSSFLSVTAHGSREKLLNLISGLEPGAEAVKAEINLTIEGKIETFQLRAVSTDRGLLIMGAVDDFRMDELSEFLVHSNPWLDSLPDSVIKGTKDNLKNRYLYDEISRLNNELVDLQRELARKNAELERFYNEARELSVTDALTGVLNRRGFFERGRQEEERYQRYGRTLTVIMFDIDNFKEINDEFDHSCGDTVLGEVARRAAAELRGVDILGRYGGDEFAVLLPETDMEGAKVVANRLLKTASEPIQSGSDTHRVTISLGISSTASRATSLESLLQEADKALYRAKNTGRNRVCTFEQ